MGCEPSACLWCGKEFSPWHGKKFCKPGHKSMFYGKFTALGRARRERFDARRAATPKRKASTMKAAARWRERQFSNGNCARCGRRNPDSPHTRTCSDCSNSPQRVIAKIARGN